MRLLAVVSKEAHLLLRDKVGLLLLVVMPVTLAVVLTLVQEDAFELEGTRTETVLWVDQDGGAFALAYHDNLVDSGRVVLVESLDGVPLTDEALRDAVSRGRHPVGLVLPEGLSEAARERAAHQASALLRPGTDLADPPDAVLVEVVFDPATLGAYKRVMTQVLSRVAEATEVELLLEALRPPGIPASEDGPAWEPGALTSLVEREPQGQVRPSVVQQNIPGWSLFAMFLIVSPLAGTLIMERDQGTLTRLRTLPVSATTLLAGKVLTYAGVCLLQVGLMGALGRWVLPLLGTPRLEVGGSPLALVAVLLASILAATGLGMLLGALARTRTQASALGATFAVLAAALGGVMVPVFLMPAPMAALAPLSPMNWGLTALHDVFLRSAGLVEIAPQLMALVGFSGVCVGLAAVLPGLRARLRLRP